jgi:hypothetical protein
MLAGFARGKRHMTRSQLHKSNNFSAFTSTWWKDVVPMSRAAHALFAVATGESLAGLLLRSEKTGGLIRIGE